MSGPAPGEFASRTSLSRGYQPEQVLGCRLVTLAAGAAAGKFLKYERKAPTVAAQTAYGIEVELEGYEEKYDGSTMLFMDFRRHHSGLWDGTATR